MFGKFKDKLKSALSIFSRKAEEEAEVTQREVEKEVSEEKIPITVEKQVVKQVESVKKEEKVVAPVKKNEGVSGGKKEREHVLIFHGWDDNSQSGFIPKLKEYLHKKEYVAESFDQPDSDKPTFEKWFSFAEKKIVQANKDNLNLVGHSMGGLLALKLAERYKVKKLIMVAPVGAKPSQDYFKLFGKNLNSEELRVFREFQDRGLDFKKIKNNVDEMAFVFGLKDPWITDEIRDFYINSFKDVAEIQVFENYAHMTESEGVKRLAILEELFARDFKVGVFDHKEKEITHSSKLSDKKSVLAQQMEHFAKVREQEKREKGEKKEAVVQKNKSLDVSQETMKETGEDHVSEEINGVKITYFVHGTTTDNERDIATGWNPGELSILGITQSKESAIKLRSHNFEVVFCSDLKRAVDSAKLMFPDRNIPIIEDARLREANYGDFNGEKASLFKERMGEYVGETFPNGESYHDVEKRMAEFVNFLFENYYGKHVAIVAHQAPQLALDVLLKQKTWEQAIAQDWRLRRAFQLGWDYAIEHTVDISGIAQREEVREQKKSFLGKLKETFSFKKNVEEEFDERMQEENIKEKPVSLPEKSDIEFNVSKVKDSKVKEVDGEILQEPQKKTIFGKIKETITSRTISSEKFEELFWDLELALLENNVSVEVIEKIKVDLGHELVGKPLPWDVGEKIHKTLEGTLREILAFESTELSERIAAKKQKPYVIAFFGINGTGKTTSIAKLTYHLQQQGLSVVLAACDTFRAAAIQQLGEHAKKLGVKMIQQDYGSDAAAVAFDAVQYAIKNKIDVVLIDTAGRLHSNTNLMAELGKIIRVVKPDLKLFVGESITGNDCIEQARQFNSLVEMDGAILTKVDVDEKGGAPLSIAYTIKKPILFLGVGQEYTDLEKFDADVILGRLGL